MNILVVNWQDRLNPLAGGAEVHLHEIFGRIASWGHKVILLTSGFPGAKRKEVLDGIQIIRRGGRSDFNFHVPYCVKEILRGEKVDIIVEDLNKIPFFTPLYVKKPVLAILLHRFGKSIFSETIFPFALYVYMAESLVPVVYRNIPFDVISESTMEDLVVSGIPRENVYLHYCGIDRTVYRPGKEGEKSFSITFVGRIKKYKSIDHLLYAIPDVLKSFPDITVAIVGDGDDIPRLKKIASSLRIDKIVEFTGFVSTRKKVSILQSSEVVVNTSIKEGWGLTVIESNACGAPVIAADSPGLRDSVKDGYSGLLYPYGDIDSLVAAIEKLLGNKKMLKKMQKNAIKWSKRFDWEKSARGILKLLQKRIYGEI
jgi:glycosyltransferase involved in cell wall biosynthesis